jgi:co-chaperonin GroES (HSP10)
MFDKFEPKGDRVLVKRLESEEKTVSLILQKKKPNWELFLPLAPEKKTKMAALFLSTSKSKIPFILVNIQALMLVMII